MYFVLLFQNIFSRSCSKTSEDKTTMTYKLEISNDKSDMFAAKSPYKVPGPRRYGYEKKYMTQGSILV